MIFSVLRLVMTSMLVLACVACGDDDAGSPGGGDADSGTGGVDAGDKKPVSGDTITLTGSALDYETDEPLAGMEYCWLDHPDVCATADAEGVFELSGLPADSDVAITGDLDGHVPIVRFVRTESTATTFEGDRYASDELLASWARSAGVTQDPDLASIGFASFGAAAVEVTLSPSSGTVTYDAPDTGMPDADQEHGVPGMSPFGAAALGVVWNVEPGEVETRYATVGEGSCTFGGWWMGSSASAARMITVAGRFSYGSWASCMGVPTNVTTLRPYEDAAMCTAEGGDAGVDAGPGVTAECQACQCDSCFEELNDCRASAGCWDIVECARAVGCMAADCYTPETCQEVIDGTPGGTGGPGGMAAGALSTCAIERCDAECN